MNCRELQKGKCEISYAYKKGVHNGVDLVGAGYTLDYIVAHSDGTVVTVVSNCNRNTYHTTKEKICGNYVKIKHDDGYYTLYAHLKYGTVAVKKGEKVTKGQVLGYMGNTGYSNGAHLHFEVRDTSDSRINPTPYIDAELPNNKPTSNYKVSTTYTTQVILKVRSGAGTNYAQVPYSKLTPNAQKYAYSNGCLKEGTRVTCLEVKHNGNDVWIRIPSGWIAAKYSGKIYVK